MTDSSPTGQPAPGSVPGGGPTPVVASIESAIQAAVVAQAMAALIAAQPWVALPVINGFVLWVVNFGVGLLMGKTLLGINDLWIQLDVTTDVQAVQDSIYTYQGLAANAASTPAQLAAAQAQLEAAASALIKINNAPF